MINGVDTEALRQTKAAVRDKPELAQVTFGIQSEWTGGTHQRATTSDVIQNGEVVTSRTATYVFESDEPTALLGTDKAASPGEYVLQALAGCYAVTYATTAAARGIELTSLAFDMQVDFDLQGFLGLDSSVRPGAQEIRVNVRAQSPNAIPEQLQELTDLVQQHSPIRDTLANPVKVTTTLVADSAS
ncbi:OsmC family protein [Streptomyces ipomoeae]|uniref:OsmC family protein n=1 Tax=Streptomyces ipomoeae TaxID=103232 RepID=UPI0011473A0A|nr:OsmC family protein [Streptomyces ipomoeae]MDX2939390.1 OsmC family protein [Streptomyces ipomoeae]TQE20509.1 OsmC family peroxiredoxin [Streptomyces ipomoeae]